ncbi:MAG: hypothetical protein H6668_04580 [Ardenticatenaceae bacterium]|nr:hypothetical protein [Ardenticatenaceae bacterium]
MGKLVTAAIASDEPLETGDEPVLKLLSHYALPGFKGFAGGGVEAVEEGGVVEGNGR